jgi:hypothetical protein
MNEKELKQLARTLSGVIKSNYVPFQGVETEKVVEVALKYLPELTEYQILMGIETYCVSDVSQGVEG